MDEIEQWDSLCKTIEKELDKLLSDQRKNKDSEYIICLNVHSGNEKIPFTKIENVKSEDWRAWRS